MITYVFRKIGRFYTQLSNTKLTLRVRLFINDLNGVLWRVLLDYLRDLNKFPPNAGVAIAGQFFRDYAGRRLQTYAQVY
jgi:hypothetical protein